MAVKLKIKKGDTVVVTSGTKRGKQGVVKSVEIEKNRAIVEGVNMVKKHTKPSAKFPQGGIIEKEAPIHISNLMLVEPKSGKPSRVGRKVVDGKIVRYTKKNNEILK